MMIIIVVILVVNLFVPSANCGQQNVAKLIQNVEHLEQLTYFLLRGYNLSSQDSSTLVGSSGPDHAGGNGPGLTSDPGGVQLSSIATPSREDEQKEPHHKRDQDNNFKNNDRDKEHNSKLAIQQRRQRSIATQLESFVVRLRNGHLHRMYGANLLADDDQQQQQQQRITDTQAQAEIQAKIGANCELLLEKYKIDTLKARILTQSSIEYESGESSSSMTAPEVNSSSIRGHEREQDIETGGSVKFDDEHLYRLCRTALQYHTAEQMFALIADPDEKSITNHLLPDNNIETPGEREMANLSVSRTISQLCPLILFQLHDSACASARRRDHARPPTSTAVWAFGTLFATIVTFCSLIGFVVAPLMIPPSQQRRPSDALGLTLFEGLAVGNLVASALFSLIPLAFELHEREVNHEFLWKALIVFFGIYLFFCSERIVKIILDKRRKRKRQKDLPLASTTDAYELGQPNTSQHNTTNARSMRRETLNQSHLRATARGRIGTTRNNRRVLFEARDEARESISTDNRDSDSSWQDDSSADDDCDEHADSHHHSRQRFHQNTRYDARTKIYQPIDKAHNGDEQVPNKEEEIATVAWMIVFGDGMYNFIDGTSIGAAFSYSILSGVSVSVAIICEELTHELGHLAVLIGSGMTVNQALGWNLLSGSTCYIGMCAGIAFGDMSTTACAYLSALTAGVFLYIALVDMMSLLSAALEMSSDSITTTLQLLLMQNIGIISGVSIIFILSFIDL